MPARKQSGQVDQWLKELWADPEHTAKLSDPSAVFREQAPIILKSIERAANAVREQRKEADHAST